MAQPAFNITLKNKTVAFAILTGKGRKGKKPENEYSLAVEMTKKERQSTLDAMNEFFDENKAKKTDVPKDDFEKFFTESKSVKGGFVFWGSVSVTDGLKYKVAPNSGFTMKNFAEIGQDSEVDAEYRLFLYNNSFGTGLGMRLSAVKLNEFVKYTGGGGNTLDGDTLQEDGTQMESSSAEAPEKKTEDIDDVIADFKEAIDDEDFEDAETLLALLSDHEDFKKLKKQLRKAKR